MRTIGRDSLTGQRLAMALCVGLGFLVTASPIFLWKKNREGSYFVRGSDQNLWLDIRRTKSWLVPFSVVADSVQAPWLVADPVRRQDLPQSRLGWILGVPVAAALLRAFARPKQELSALLFAQAGAALLASLRWGSPGHPNGFRFVYLTTLTAVAAAAGVLWLVGLFRPSWRRPAAIAAIGLLCVGAALGARDALFRWGESRSTFDAYWGESTLIGRAASRWQRYGLVELDANLPHSPLVVAAVRDERLDPDARRIEATFFASARVEASGRCFRIASPGTSALPGERRVEVIRDAWGRAFGVILARRCRGPRPLIARLLPYTIQP